MSDDSTPEQDSSRHPETGRFLPGRSGNPSGRPKGRLSMRAAIEKQLQRNARARQRGEDPAESGPTADEIARHLLRQAMREDPAALGFIREVIDRIDGKAIQAVEVSGPDGEAVRIAASDVRDRLLSDLGASDSGDEPGGTPEGAS